MVFISARENNANETWPVCVIVNVPYMHTHNIMGASIYTANHHWGRDHRLRKCNLYDLCHGLLCASAEFGLSIFLLILPLKLCYATINYNKIGKSLLHVCVQAKLR